MYRGEFTSDGPHIRGVLRFPLGATQPLVHVDFLIDTGAEQTLIMPDDYMAAGIRFRDFQRFPTGAPVGVGGPITVRIVPSLIWLREEEAGDLKPHLVVIQVAEPNHITVPLPSLLGRDFTDQFRLIIDPTNDVLVLDDPEKYR
jgi:hypothetical protein